MNEIGPVHRRILELLSDGFTVKGVSAELRMSHRTIEKYRQEALNKLGADTVIQAVAMAVRRGIIA